MSYYVEFDRVFRRSAAGYTPLILLGDSSLREPKHGRIARSWTVFQRLLGVSQNGLLAATAPMLGCTQEHWKRGGTWVDDAGLIRWVRSGCQNAVSLEDLLKVNDRPGVACRLCGYGTPAVLSRVVRTTAELDGWIAEAKQAMEANKALWPEIELDSLGERMKHPGKPREPEEKVLVKGRYGYLASYTEDSSNWVRDKQKALILTAREAQELPPLARGRMVSASVLDTVGEFVVEIIPSNGVKSYLHSFRGPGRFRYSADPRNAKRYSSMAAAKRAAEAAHRRAPSWSFSAAAIEESKQNV